MKILKEVKTIAELMGDANRADAWKADIHQMRLNSDTVAAAMTDLQTINSNVAAGLTNFASGNTVYQRAVLQALQGIPSGSSHDYTTVLNDISGALKTTLPIGGEQTLAQLTATNSTLLNNVYIQNRTTTEALLPTADLGTKTVVSELSAAFRDALNSAFNTFLTDRSGMASGTIYRMTQEMYHQMIFSWNALTLNGRFRPITVQGSVGITGTVDTHPYLHVGSDSNIPEAWQPLHGYSTNGVLLDNHEHGTLNLPPNVAVPYDLPLVRAAMPAYGAGQVQWAPWRYQPMLADATSGAIIEELMDPRTHGLYRTQDGGSDDGGGGVVPMPVRVVP